MFTILKEASKRQKLKSYSHHEGRFGLRDGNIWTPDHGIIREDDGVTVRTARKKETKSASHTPSASVLDEASNVALSPSPNVSSPEKLQSPATPFLTAPRHEKILPVVIHYNFEGDPPRINKEFHSKYQPIGFST